MAEVLIALTILGGGYLVVLGALFVGLCLERRIGRPDIVDGWFVLVPVACVFALAVSLLTVWIRGVVR